MKTRWGTVLITAALIGLPVAAAEPSAESLIVGVKGVQKGRGIQLQVQGGFATRGIRIYSEPSNTLLAVFIDSAFQKTADGQNWLSAALSESENRDDSLVVSGELPGLLSNLSPSPRPAGDDEIIVWVNGSWPDGSEEDRLVAQNRSVGNNFGFSVNAVDNPSVAGGVQVCCSGVTCGGVCRTCPTTTFTCCCGCGIICASVDCCEPD